MNGIEFLKKIRQKNPIIPFIIFTGRGREDVAIEALNSGGHSICKKTESCCSFIELSIW
jgi:DNA-binding response OmpR family regulator